MPCSYDREEICGCGHPADDHHVSLCREGGYLFDECEYYGFNETGGLMPVHEGSNVPCEFSSFGPASRADDGEWRDSDGYSQDEFPFCQLKHRWEPHCGHFQAGAR